MEGQHTRSATSTIAWISGKRAPWQSMPFGRHDLCSLRGQLSLRLFGEAVFVRWALGHRCTLDLSIGHEGYCPPVYTHSAELMDMLQASRVCFGCPAPCCGALPAEERGCTAAARFEAGLRAVATAGVPAMVGCCCRAACVPRQASLMRDHVDVLLGPCSY